MKPMNQENIKEINKLLDGFYIHDCCILSDKYFCMIAEEYSDEDDYDSSGSIKQVSYNLRNPDIPPRWTRTHWPAKNVFLRPKMVNSKRDEVLVVGDNRYVYYLGLGKNKQFEDEIPVSLSPGVSSLKRIDNEIYLVDAGRTVIKRVGIDKWESLEKDYMWDDSQNALQAGFRDIDGFSSNDLYAAGGHTDVWRYDGQDWLPLDVTDHIKAYTVCCADDGFVYIAGSHGVVVRGRENDWKTYIPSESDELSDTYSCFSSSVSYQGRVYLGGESIGTFYIDHNSDDITPQPYDFNGEIDPFSARFMSVGYGMMMFADQYRAAVHDGEKWIDLYGAEQQQEMEALQVKQMSLLKSGEILDDVIDFLDHIETNHKK